MEKIEWKSHWFINNFFFARVFGLFNFMQTAYRITDPELIKRITIKEVNHDQSFDDIDRVFSKSLFSLHSQQWREMRT